MNKKNIVLAVVFAACLIFAFVDSANAGPLGYYFDEYNCVYVEVVPLGTIGSSSWTILVKVPMSGGGTSLGMSFYNPSTGALCIHVDNNEYWNSHSYEGTWTASPSEFVLAIHTLVTETRYLYNLPPAPATAGVDATAK